MKTIFLGFALGLLSAIPQAQAQVLTIPPKTSGLSPIAGKVTTVESRRVPLGDAVMGSETRVTLQFTLAGCVDKLMPLISHSETKDENVTFYVTALNAHNEVSKRINCVALPQESATLTVPGLFQQNQIRVVFLGQPGSTANPPTTSSTQSNRDIFYLSSEYGFRFVSPKDYVIEPSNAEPSTQGNTPLQVLKIWQQADFVNRTEASESPPIISLSIYNNSQKLPLAKWKGELSRNDDRSLTVAEQPAIAYTSTGLYEYENVLLSSPDGRYVFRLQAGYQDANSPMRQVFQEVVNSFSFDAIASSSSPGGWRINYNRLQNLLSAKNWQAADVETRAIMQRLAGTKGDLLYSSKSVVNQLPCEDLRTIDTLWSKASSGRFGYTAQQRIWQQSRAQNSKQQVERFGRAVGWRRNQPIKDDPLAAELGTQWRFDTDLNNTAAAPVGQFPWGGISSSRLTELVTERSRGCGSCTIDAMYLASQRYEDYLPAMFTKLNACRLPKT